MRKTKKRISRTCIVCGKRINLTVYKDGKISNHHYFGNFKIPIKNTGEYKKVGTTKIGRKKIDVIKWTGKERECEYWECDSCFKEAQESA